jgi:hypothetical protein
MSTATSTFPGQPAVSAIAPKQDGLPTVTTDQFPALADSMTFTYKPAGPERRAPSADIELTMADGGKKRIRVQTPRMRIPWGISDNSKWNSSDPSKIKFTADLSFDRHETDKEQNNLLKFIMSVETRVIREAKKNKADWLPLIKEAADSDELCIDDSNIVRRPMTDQEVMKAFRSAIKPKKTVKKDTGEMQTYPAMFKGKCRKNKNNDVVTSFWRDDVPDPVTKKMKVAPCPMEYARCAPKSGGLEVSLIIEASSVWFMPTTETFGVTWNVNQVRIYSDKVLSSGYGDCTSSYAFGDGASVVTPTTNKRSREDDESDSHAAGVAKKAKTEEANRGKRTRDNEEDDNAAPSAKKPKTEPEAKETKVESVQ